MNTVSKFFSVCESRFERDWGAGPGRPLEAAAERLREQQRIRTPGLPRAAVGAYLAECLFGTAHTSTFCEFLAYAGYQSLDCEGFVELAPTASFLAWRSSVENMSVRLARPTQLAFAFDPPTGATLCLRRQQSDDVPDVCVVDEAKFVTRAFSSFEAMLRILTAILDSSTALHVPRGAEPSNEQRALLATLVALDPDGFGRTGWEGWYRRAVGGSGW